MVKVNDFGYHTSKGYLVSDVIVELKEIKNYETLCVLPQTLLSASVLNKLVILITKFD